MRSLSELKEQTNVMEDEIDLKELWGTMVRRRYLIASIAFCIFFLTIVYVFLSTNIYATYSSVEIDETSKSYAVKDIDIFSGELAQNSNLSNEMEIIKSRELLLKLLGSLPLNTRYFNDGVFEKTESYTKRPFDLQINNITTKLKGEITFYIELIDENSYHIEAKSPEESTYSWELDGEYRYNESIKTPYFDFTLKPTQNFSLEKCDCRITYEPDKNVFIDSFIRPQLSVASVSKDASIIKVSFEDTIAQRGVDFVNTLIEVYFEQKISYQKEELKEKLKFVDEQLQTTYSNLSQSQVQIKDFKQANTIATIPNSSLTLLTTLVEVDTQLQQTDMRLNVLESLIAGIKSDDEVSISIDALDIAGSSMHGTITALQQKNATRKALLTEYTPKHPDVVQITQEIDTLKQSFYESIKSLYKSTKKQKADLEATKISYEASLGKMPTQELGLMNLSRDFEVNQKMYLYLLEKKAEFEILNAATISKNRILDRAIIYPQPVKPKKMLIVMAGFVLGLIIGIFVAFIREFFNNKIITPEDVERITDIPMYGVVPENKKEETAFMESLNMIRTNMEFISSESNSKVIMISSNIPEEGKTTISANLARTLAKGNKKVLLLDLDMRKSKLLREFPNLNVKDGASSLLVGKATLDGVMMHTEENLDVIFAGKIPPNPSELLLSSNIEKIINELKSSYDYVIIDTAPIGLVTDTMILLKKQIHDLFLVVLRSEFTDKSLLTNFNKMIHKHHLRSVGLILNGVKITQGNYYGYGYGYGYGADEKTK